jgi:murein DD-endopeptidase MepM/ murein hydrolase activator NlpD
VHKYFRIVKSISIIIVCVCGICTISYAWYRLSRDVDIQITPAYSIFGGENEYYNHISSKVSFEGIKFEIVSVKSGDNFWKIARRYAIDIDTLIAANPYWTNLDARTNEKVVVPSEKGVLIFIYDFDQMERIRSMYGVKDEDILVQKTPFLYSLYRRFTDSPDPIGVFIRNARPKSTMMTEPLAKQFAIREMFRSPLGGRYTSFFGRRLDPIVHTGQFHAGVDIESSTGTPVGAAAGGVVSSAGWMGGYGKAVVVEHENGYRTLYGHLSRIAVRPGQRVKAGQFVGRVGSTGWSTGPHLHFTIWHNERCINPMKVLW